jgi:hypothetical protein
MQNPDLLRVKAAMMAPSPQVTASDRIQDRTGFIRRRMRAITEPGSLQPNLSSEHQPRSVQIPISSRPLQIAEKSVPTLGQLGANSIIARRKKV